MSDAIFWFDNRTSDKAANGVPAAVISRMASEVQNQRTHLQNLRKNADDVLRHIELKPEYGLFIRGTTGDIIAALAADRSYGIEHIGVVNDDSLHIRYFRHKAGANKTVSYIGIAGGQYWGSVPFEYDLKDARRNKTWCHMAQGNKSEAYDEWQREQRHGHVSKAPLLVTSIPLKNLEAIIRNRKGEDAWL